MPRARRYLWLGFPLLLAMGGAPWAQALGGTGPLPIVEGPVAVRRVERGALLVEPFAGTEPDLSTWRVWHSDPDRASFAVRDGRFELIAEGDVGHNGLWQLACAKYKDVALVARMDVRSDGPDPQPLALHLCGGDATRSPDHWTEIVMYDEGPRARFSYWSTAPNGAFAYDPASEVVLDRHGSEGFLAKVELDAGTNLATTWVRDDGVWRQVGPAVELLLRTVHCEVKFRGGLPAKGPGVTTSRGWFSELRMYPRPETHPVGVRLVREDGSQIWSRGADEAWPPKIRVGDGPERSIEDLAVELWTLDGAMLVSRIQSQNMGYYMLPLNSAPWDAYPVAARLRLVLDGQPLGQDVAVPLDGLDGLYPDDVWNLVVR